MNLLLISPEDPWSLGIHVKEECDPTKCPGGGSLDISWIHVKEETPMNGESGWRLEGNQDDMEEENGDDMKEECDDDMKEEMPHRWILSSLGYQ